MKTLLLLLFSTLAFGQSILIEPSKIGEGNGSASATTQFSNRLRVKSNPGYSAGVWMNNSLNNTTINDGAFWGMKTDQESGVWIGGAWRFWVNNAGKVYSTSLMGIGTRFVIANPDGSLGTTLSSGGSSQKIKTVSGINFKVNSNNSLHRLNLAIAEVHGNEGEVYGFLSQIELENGASINRIEVDFLNQVASPHFNFTVRKMEKTSGFPSTIASSLTSIATSSMYRTQTISFSETIDNNQYYYFIYFDVTNSSGSLLQPWPNFLYARLKGYRVFYSL